MKQSAAASLLLTNLRLLDYNFDSFEITADVFTSLNNKGKAFEHIIYHLFRTFDPEECELKLQGCWPIYEPAQSRELRNVVFKWLEDLKKSGRLGGVLVRRSTLDDCSGSRYEELLLALSTMVLRDQFEQGVYPNFRQTFAYQLATSTQPAQSYLAPLTCAHKSGLRKILKERQASKEQWSSFDSLLDEREAVIASMSKHCYEHSEEETKSTTYPRGFEDRIRSKWRNNWLGDPKWLEIILNGDPESTRDEFLELSFEQAFTNQRHFRDGGTGVSLAGKISLKGLERQVDEQRNRVQKMRRLREQSLSGLPSRSGAASPGKVSPAKRVGKKGLPVEFAKHQKLHAKDFAGVATGKRRTQSEYNELLENLRDELMLVSAPSQRIHQKPEVPVIYHYEHPELGHDEAHGHEERQDRELYHVQINLQEEDNPDPTHAAAQSVPPSHRSPHAGLHLEEDSQQESRHEDEVMDAMEIDHDGMDIDGVAAEHSNNNPKRTPQPTVESKPQHQLSASSSRSYLIGSDDEAFRALPTPATSLAPAQPATPRHVQAVKKPSFRDSLGFGDDDFLAEQIVSNIAGTTVSPEKEAQPDRSRRFSPNLSANISPVDSPSQPSFSVDEGDMTLLPQHPFHKDERILHPRKVDQQPMAGTTTPKEEILVSEDYNSVFKSRPKIAMSPTASPSPSGMAFGRLDMNMTKDDYSDTDEAMEYISSPLAHKNRRV